MLMHHSERAVATAFLALVCVGAAHAGERIDETRQVTESPTVEVENLSGNVSIKGWDKAIVHVTGSLSPHAEGLDITGDDQRLYIRVRHPKHAHHGWGHKTQGDSTQLELRVPTATSMRVKTVTADIDIQGLTGERQDLRSVSGDIDIREVMGTRLSAHTVSGDIDSRATAAEQRLQTVSGDITSRGAVAMLEAETVSGNIDALELPSEFSLGTVSGDVVAIAKALVHRARLSSTSGGAEFEGQLARTGVLELESMSGNAVARLRSSPSEIYAKSSSGSILSTWGEPVKPKYGPGARLDYCTEGKGGDGRVEAVSFSGSVRISD